VGRHVVIAAQTGLSGSVVVEDYAVIGGQVGIGDKARIETRARPGFRLGRADLKSRSRGRRLLGHPRRVR
jgi:UDP-3-O-[3-hydroxymyristoyl] glucosamine N-acyltransferase